MVWRLCMTAVFVLAWLIGLSAIATGMQVIATPVLNVRSFRLSCCW